jgi:LmbE family N-acetylglucosaminyl deacetylase
MSGASRREFLGSGLALSISPEVDRKLKVVCVGGHPDDPESGCGGTLAKYRDAGHAVTIIYLTRGERGIRGKSLDEAAAIRTGEAREACRILGAKPVFAGQIDGATEYHKAAVEAFIPLLAAEEPDLVFTQWPIDTHMDHQVASMLTLRTYWAARKRFPIYFYEVNAGDQTQGFRPTAYVDITTVQEQKKAALFAHKSQNGEEIYRRHHGPMESFRGREAGVAAAEAFIQFGGTVPLL